MRTVVGLIIIGIIAFGWWWRHGLQAKPVGVQTGDNDMGLIIILGACLMLGVALFVVVFAGLIWAIKTVWFWV